MESYSSSLRATPYAAWATFGAPLFQGLVLLPVIVYCLLLGIMSLMLVIGGICARFPRAAALPPLAAVCRVLAHNSNVCIAREYVQALLHPAAVRITPDPAPLRRRISAAFAGWLRLPRVPVTCVIMSCISLQLGFVLTHYWGNIVIEPCLVLLPYLSSSGIVELARIAPPIIITLVSLPACYLAFQTLSLASRMRTIFMSALDDLAQHAKPFRAGARERCSMQSATLFLPMFVAYTAVSFTMLGGILYIIVVVVLVVASVQVYCFLLDNGTFSYYINEDPVALARDLDVNGLLSWAVLKFSQTYACPACNDFTRQISLDYFKSGALAFFFFLLLYPNYFRICRTLDNNTRSPCIGQQRGKHLGRLTVVRPAAAGAVAVVTSDLWH